jgi:ubiquinone/menaquinone biosynthesis C-methylase UbiE
MTELDLLSDKYFNECFPRASDYELAKLRKDWGKKDKAGDGIVNDFTLRAGNPAGKKILDVGFGNGAIVAAFARAGATVSGIEVNEQLYKIGVELAKEYGDRVSLKLYDGEHFPYDDTTFDFVYSTSVIEHVTYPVQVMREIYRVLKPGGRLYIAFPNSFVWKETHTGLYGLSYLPRFIGKHYLKITGRSTYEDWNLFFRTYFWLRRLLRRNHIPFKVIFETDSASTPKRLFKKMLAFFGIHHSALLSHVIVILEKPRV